MATQHKVGFCTLCRSRCGFSTKINARTNAEGLPIGLVFTPGQIHDVTAFPALMEEVDCDPEQCWAIKAVRQQIVDHGGQPLIPTKKNRKYNTPPTRPSTAYATASSGSSIA